MDSNFFTFYMLDFDIEKKFWQPEIKTFCSTTDHRRPQNPFHRSNLFFSTAGGGPPLPETTTSYMPPVSSGPGWNDPPPMAMFTSKSKAVQVSILGIPISGRKAFGPIFILDLWPKCTDKYVCTYY
jgi:hypothetical protein